MALKYVDIPAIMQVIGGVYINNSFLDNENYFFNEEDFPNEFHKIVFGSMYNLHMLGAKNVIIHLMFLKEGNTMAKKNENRVLVSLVCEECKTPNYTVSKNKKNTTERLELNKYCSRCRKTTNHKEKK